MDYDMERLFRRFDVKIESLNSMTLTRDVYFTEAKDTRSLVVKIKQFIARIFAAVSTFKNDIVAKISLKLSKSDLKAKIRQLKNDAEKMAALGHDNIKAPDYDAYYARMQRTLKEIKPVAKKISKGNYNKAYEAEDDLDKFNAILSQSEKELETISKTEKVMSIPDAIQFCEDELRGKGKIMSGINEIETVLREMEVDAMALSKKVSIMGDDIVYCKVGIIQKMMTRILKFMRNTIGTLLSILISPLLALKYLL